LFGGAKNPSIVPLGKDHAPKLLPVHINRTLKRLEESLAWLGLGHWVLRQAIFWRARL